MMQGMDSVFIYEYQIVLPPSVERLSFFHLTVLAHTQKLTDHIFFWTLLFYGYIYLSSHQHHYFDYFTIISFRNQIVLNHISSSSKLFCLSPLHFHRDFKTSLSLSTNCRLGFWLELHWIYICRANWQYWVLQSWNTIFTYLGFL